MSDATSTDWVLPASIPFADLKAKDLEECVYWLLDAMGLKDLEWRVGGTGGGAADGGRDLEANYYILGANGALEPQKWWIECKGRTGTVESDEVKKAVVNSMAKANLGCLVIATNTQFSNPTREWVKEWEETHKRKVQLWDKATLELYLSKHPDVVLRLFSEALSIDGRMKAMETRFWNMLEYVPQKTLVDLWKAREEVEFTGLAFFAAVVNEFANGSIIHRPWGAALSPETALEVLSLGLTNVPYLTMRGTKAGVEMRPIARALAYLLLVAIDLLPADVVARIVEDSVYRGKKGEMPKDVKELLLMPIIDQLLSEMQDVCSSDCVRISTSERNVLTDGGDEVDTYWLRFDPDGVVVPDKKRFLRIESTSAPCAVGFSVGADKCCPLFAFEANANNVEELFAIIKRVAAFRKAQAKDKRNAASA